MIPRIGNKFCNSDFLQIWTKNYKSEKGHSLRLEQKLTACQKVYYQHGVTSVSHMDEVASGPKVTHIIYT